MDFSCDDELFVRLPRLFPDLFDEGSHLDIAVDACSGSALLLLICVGVGRIVSLTEAASSDFQCLDEPSNAPKIKNELHIGDQKATLWIAAGSRPIDRMLAFILRAILRESVGYKDAELLKADYNYTQWLRAMACNSDEEYCATRPMMHIGLMETDNQEQDEASKKYVRAIGELGPRLRRGWFVPSEKHGSTQPTQYAMVQ
ncbi:hypothetical protein BIW11_04474 [Tropilaelaps mercedesae]|uniref:Uncharacterized protein n=1 Tax=Tropilaelaps mercedesae TaxID=418985 RepID=A0A1V9X5N0_9ACAR|nr:hypothetical protein BIW11_04474 [Tropilaelaps mercedesae]